MATTNDEGPELKPVLWLGSSHKDIRELPADVQDELGHALLQVQLGGRPAAAKPLSGFGGAGVLEIVEDGTGGTFRLVYTVKFPPAVYVLHVFQKKSKTGRRTPPAEMNVVRARLKEAEDDHAERFEKPKTADGPDD